MKNPAALIWTGLFASQFIYAAILDMLIPPGKELSNEQITTNPVFLILGVLALAHVPLAWFIPKILWKQRAKTLPESDRTTDAVLLEAYFTGFIVRLALLEAVCVIGFVGSIIAHRSSLILPFLGVSAAGFVVNFPTKTHIRSALGRPHDSF
jgi:hypothetical protein